MKRINQLWVLLLTITLLSFNSCSSDDDGGATNQASQGTISAKINGVNFTSLEITSFASLTTGGNQTTLTMQGNTTTQAISMIIIGYDGVGTYQLTDANVFRSASYIEPNINDPINSPTWNAPFENSGVIGEINISEDTATTIQGTFNFTAKNVNDGSTKSITDGVFNLEKM